MRLKSVVAAALVGVFALFGEMAHGQWTLDRQLRVAVGAATILNIYSNRPLALYWEIEGYSSLYRSESAGMTLRESLYVGAWMDDGKGTADCSHCVSYSQRSAIVGTLRSKTEGFIEKHVPAELFTAFSTFTSIRSISTM